MSNVGVDVVKRMSLVPRDGQRDGILIPNNENDSDENYDSEGGDDPLITMRNTLRNRRQTIHFKETPNQTGAWTRAPNDSKWYQI